MDMFNVWRSCWFERDKCNGEPFCTKTLYIWRTACIIGTIERTKGILVINPYQQMIGRLNTRQFQKLQIRMGELIESERFLMLYRQLEIEIEMDENDK